jgi:microcystin-dependent protein
MSIVLSETDVFSSTVNGIQDVVDPVNATTYNTIIQALVNRTRWLYNRICPAGQVSYFASQLPPAGWVECDGVSYARTTFPALFAAIGTFYGQGDTPGATFRVPDFRGLFIRCLNTSGIGYDINRSYGTFQDTQNLAHTHTVTHLRDWANPPISAFDAVYGDEQQEGTNTLTTSSSGGNESRPVNVALRCCIRT